MTPSDSEFLSAVPVIENAHNKRRTSPVNLFGEQFTVIDKVKPPLALSLND